jgi:hypothetical protein
MPSVQDAINTDRSSLTPIDNAPKAEQKPPAALSDSRINSLLKSPYARCPLPPSNNSADSLRQWGQGSEVPKFRTQTPPTNSGNGGGSSTSSVVVVSSSSSSGTSVTPVLPSAQNVSVTTSVLAPSQTWVGTLQMAKGFLVINLAGSSFCRVELYSSKTAQMLDIGRPVSQAPANTTSGLIMDVVLLTALSWQVLDCVGSNGDSPQSSTIYITVTNVSTAAQAFTVSLQFVPSEA